METLFKQCEKDINEIHQCITTALTHFGGLYREGKQNTYIPELENFFGFKDGGFDAIIASLTTMMECKNILEYYYIDYKEPEVQKFYYLKPHRKLIYIGVLNTCYVMINAVTTGCNTFNIQKEPTVKSLIRQINKTDIAQVRHRLASHNTNLSNGAFHFFSEVEENTFSSFTSGTKRGVEDYDLKDNLKNYFEIQCMLITEIKNKANTFRLSA